MSYVAIIIAHIVHQHDNHDQSKERKQNVV